MMIFRNRKGWSMILLASAAAPMMVMNVGPAHAQDRSIRFNIPASALAQALRAYAAQSGQEILFSDASVQGIRSQGVSGPLSSEQALMRLLAKSGFEGLRGHNGVWIIRRTAPARAVMMPIAAVGDAQAPQAAPTPRAAPPPPAPVEEIIVTAQRRAQGLQDVPLSVSVVSGNALASQNIRTLEDLSGQQPALRIAQGPASDQLHVRGVGSGFNPGFEQSVATFVDGVYRSRSRSSRVALFDIDRVEILKGPQTTFFGANAIAGALNITTRKPGALLAANASALYAPTDGEYNVEAGVNVPLTDGVSMRFAGRLSGMDGYIKNDRLDSDGPHLNDKQGRVAFHAEKGAVTIDARYDIARLRDTGTFNAEIVGCSPDGLPAAGLCARALAMNGGMIDDRLDRHASGGTNSYSNVNLDEGAFTARIDLGPANLVATSAYLNQSASQLVDLIPLPGLSPLGTPGYIPLVSSETFKQLSQEVRIESSSKGPIDYIVGGYYEFGDLYNSNISGLYFAPFGAFLPGILTPASRIAAAPAFSQESETFSGFGSFTYHPTGRLSLTGSLRYTRVEKRATRSLIFGTAGAVPGPDNFVPLPASAQAPLSQVIGQSLAAFPQGQRVDDALMPAANISYRFDGGILAYASYTRGFKAGGFSATTPDLFDPEFVNAYEIGLKASWFDRRLTTNIAVYRADYSDLQESQNTTTIAGTVLSVIDNAAKSRSQGIEVVSTLQVTDGLRLRADISYLDSRYQSYPDAPCSPLEAAPGTTCAHDASGQRRAFAPKWSGALGADYTQSLSAGLQLGLGGTLAFSSAYYQQSTISDLVQQDGFAKLDARMSLGAPDRRWELSVIGRNLTNKQTAAFRNYTPGAGATVTAVADRPRSVAIQISGRW